MTAPLSISGWQTIAVAVISILACVACIHLGTRAKGVGRWGRQHTPSRGGRSVADLLEDRDREQQHTGRIELLGEG